MRFAPPRPKDDDERILPLINVVLLLLIFFMLAGRLAASDPFQIAPPHSLSEGPAAAQDIAVLVGADGRLALDGTVMDEATLASVVADRLSTDPAAMLHLKADGRTEATRVIALLELLRDAGVGKLKLLTVPGTR